MKILIDNGHGEETPNKRSPDGKLREFAYTREIARAVVRRLRRSGVDADLLVHETNDVSLKERVRRVNEYCNILGASNVALVSIHNNAYKDNGEWQTPRGWSAYTTKGQTSSDKLAAVLYEEAIANFKGHKIRLDISDGDNDWEENFYILVKTKCTAVLTENFFMDNKKDVQYLLSSKGKDTIIRTHVNAIVKYIKQITQ